MDGGKVTKNDWVTFFEYRFCRQKLQAKFWSNASGITHRDCDAGGFQGKVLSVQKRVENWNGSIFQIIHGNPSPKDLAFERINSVIEYAMSS